MAVKTKLKERERIEREQQRLQRVRVRKLLRSAEHLHQH